MKNTISTSPLKKYDNPNQSLANTLAGGIKYII